MSKQVKGETFVFPCGQHDVLEITKVTVICQVLLIDIAHIHLEHCECSRLIYNLEMIFL